VLTGQAAAAGAATKLTGAGANGALINAGAGVAKVSAAKLATGLVAAKSQALGLGGAAGWVTSSVIAGAIGAAVLVNQSTSEVPSRPESSTHARAGENTTMGAKQTESSHLGLAATAAPSEETAATPDAPRAAPEPTLRNAHNERALTDARWPIQGARGSATSPERDFEPAAARRAEDSLGREAEELRAASRALDVSPQEALELVQRHRQELPRSQLATERRVLELRALLALGQTASARRLGLALLDDPRAALYHERVRRLLAVKRDPTPEASQ
jgi:hypothetical protein